MHPVDLPNEADGQYTRTFCIQYTVVGGACGWGRAAVHEGRGPPRRPTGHVSSVSITSRSGASLHQSTKCTNSERSERESSELGLNDGRHLQVFVRISV